jgi:hypothetical protein
MSKIINGKRQVQAHEIPQIMAFFKTGDTAGGMAEPPAAFDPAPFAEPVKPRATLDALTRAACPGTARTFAYVARRGELGAGILAGDILILTHGNTAGPGGLVLVSTSGEAGEGQNELRRFFAPHLASIGLDHPRPEMSDETGEAGIIGTVAAVIRAPSLDLAQGQ